jgi:Reverse transcriptase (RNA-dependent DNA polymerase)
VLISLDISAAFDAIDHGTLLNRVEIDFGVSGKVLEWLGSFLTNRTQAVVVGKSISRTVRCEFGVPQGSVLGPILFTLYTSPLAGIVKSYGATHSAYADDANILSALRSTDRGECAAELATIAIRDWYTSNGMLLNVDKSDALIAGTRAQLAKCNDKQSINAAGSSIVCSNKLKSLGVIIDDKLSLDQWVGSIVSSCNYHLRAFQHIRPVLNDDLAEMVGRAIVLSRLDYCNSLLAGISQSNLNRLQNIQNRCLRIIKRLPFRCHITSELASMHWLPVRERIVYKLAVLTYVARTTNQPEYLAELLNAPAPIRSLRSGADVSRLVVPATKTKLQERSFRVAAPTLWNSLPHDIRICDSLATFKSAMKTYLFDRAYLSA